MPLNDDGAYAGAIARWLRDDLRAGDPLAKTDNVEAMLVIGR